MTSSARLNACGTSVFRFEDARFVAGKGRYTEDRFQPGDLVCGFVRSEVANGRITSIETEDAAAMDGVVAVLTGKDITEAGARPMTCVYDVPTADGKKMIDPGRPALVLEHVRFVGDPIVLVVAENAQTLADAMEAVWVEIESEDHVTGLKAAVEPGAPQIWEQAPGNISFHWEHGDADKVDAIFDDAAHVVEADLTNNRVAISPLEPRGIRCHVEAESGRTILETATQGAHELRNYLADDIFVEPQESFLVITPDVGGSFGMKIMGYAEHVAMVVAARKVGRPVVWMSSRSESLMSDNHGRDHETTVSLALDKNGKFLAIKCDTLANMGAYLAQTGAMIPTLVYSTVFGGCYDFAAIHMKVRGVFTNQPSTDAYRGAGVPESIYVLERLVDIAADRLGFDRIELRRANLVTPDRMPYDMAVGETVDVGDYPAAFEKATALAGLEDFEERRAVAAERGKKLGFGLSCYIHGTGGYPMHDTARVRLDAHGKATLFCGAVQAGQGHETAFAQIVADKFGLAPEDVQVFEGNSDHLTNSGGTGGSSSMVVAARSVDNAMKNLVEGAKEPAAQLLQLNPEEVTFADGLFRGTNADATVPLSTVAAEVLATEPSDYFEGKGEFSGNFRSFPYGTHICEVEVDEATFEVSVVSYIAVDDIGRVINPMIAEGQLHGGVAQGLGQALRERVVYDVETGQLVTGSLMDYQLPRADVAPKKIIWETAETLAQYNHLGMKGIGEVGTIAAPPAAINAVCHALGVQNLQMPATMQNIFDKINS